MLHNDFKQFMFGLETKRSKVKLLETLQGQFLLNNICLIEIYLQAGQIVKTGFNTLNLKCIMSFCLVSIVLNINRQFIFKEQDY